jgi:hypothetical protein
VIIAAVAAGDRLLLAEGTNLGTVELILQLRFRRNGQHAIKWFQLPVLVRPLPDHFA